jgi:hypothetical protein
VQRLIHDAHCWLHQQVGLPGLDSQAFQLCLIVFDANDQVEANTGHARPGCARHSTPRRYDGVVWTGYLIAQQRRDDQSTARLIMQLALEVG